MTASSEPAARITPSRITPSRRQAALLAVGVLYLVVCAGAFRVAPAWLPDSEIYWTLGRSLAQDGVYTRSGAGGVPELLRTPGYPLVIALAWRLAPDHPYAALAVLQCLLFAGIACLTAGVGRRVLEDDRGAWAGVLTLVYPPLVYYLPAVLMEITLTAAGMAFVATWLAYVRRPALGTAAVLGFAGAGLALVRPSFALVPLLILGERIYRCFRARGETRPDLRRLSGQLGLVLLIHGALLGPWMARNWQLSAGRLPNPLGVGSGIILLLRATAQFTPAGELTARTDPTFLLANDAAPPGVAAASDAYCLAWARSLIRTHLPEYLRECVYLGGYRLWCEAYKNGFPAGALLGIRLMGVGLLLLAAAGAWLFRDRAGLLPVTLLLGYTAVIHCVGPAVARYTLPCRPLLIVLATGALLLATRALLRFARQRRPARSPAHPPALRSEES